MVRDSRQEQPHRFVRPDPEYTIEARKANVQGTVVVSVNVGIDGITRNIKVERGLGMGLDQKAVEIVQEWLFRPPLENGKPISKKLSVEVVFRVGNQFARKPAS